VRIEFTADAGHCSDIDAYVLIDGNVERNARLGPGQSTGRFARVLTPGVHRFTVMANGILGGCNTGRIGSWEGVLKIRRYADGNLLPGETR
jgi:hypothetical protein